MQDSLICAFDYCSCSNGIKIINFSEKICSSVHMEPLSLVAKKWGGLRFREAVAGVTIAQLLTMMISLQHWCDRGGRCRPIPGKG